MTCRCNEVGLNEVFNERFMRRDAQHYRKHGLETRAQLLLKMIESAMELSGRRSLEGGAGAGAFTVELARRGVSHAQAVDAMTEAVKYGRDLADQFGVLQQTSFAVGDFADAALAIDGVDLVVLDRVVCCYPDWRALLINATQRAQHVVALTYPRKNALTRLMTRTANGVQAILRRTFRLHLHEPAAMLALLAERGFTSVQTRRYWFWEIAVARR
jgi:magnesium-protoporphyrin O-methyltransferase